MPDLTQTLYDVARTTAMTTAMAPCFNASSAISTRAIKDEVPSRVALSRLTGGGQYPLRLLNGCPTAMLQQGIKGCTRNLIWLNKTNLEKYFNKPFKVDQSTKQDEIHPVARALTNCSLIVGTTMNEIIATPFSVRLTRIYETTAQPKTFFEYFAGTTPAVVKLGITSGVYLLTKATVDNGVRAVGINPKSTEGAIAAAPINGLSVTLPTQPIERIMRTMQREGSRHLTFFNATKTLAEDCRMLLRSEGVLPMMQYALRGWQARLAGNTLFSVALNVMILMGNDTLQDAVRPSP